MKVVILRLVFPLGLLCLMLIGAALLVGVHLSGEEVAAFTTNTYQTHSMYVSDMERGMNFYIEFSGHEDQLPVWSRQVGYIVFYPRSR